jgi:tetratricopeptide (TPR) repeat protein
MLEEEILPALMRTRRERTRRLRIRSAGCATGEEPYSIAISISKVTPDMQDWDITLLATDINPRFQQQASEGVYREWSFRDTPPWITARYFSRQPGGRLAILPAIQQMVKFAYLNLVDDELCAHNQASAQALALFARACANQGQLTEARQWCEQAIAADRLDARLHFLLATILQEQDALDDAVLALKRALYLDQHFVLAHLTLGTLELRQGKCKAAAKHFETVLALLSAYRPHEVLPESDGMTAGRLREIIASMYQQHTTQ